MEWNAVAEAINKGGVIPMLIIFLAGFVREWWVFGRELKAERADKEFWRDRALEADARAERAVGLAETVVR